MMEAVLQRGFRRIQVGNKREGDGHMCSPEWGAFID